MKKIIIKVIMLIYFCIAMSCGKNFSLESNGIKNGEIEAKYGGKGKTINGIGAISIPLSWENAPKGTKSYAIVMLDDDAIPVVGVSWIHWSVANIPVTMSELKENESRENKDLVQGVNSWISPIGGLSKEEASFYGGPLPPDKDHTYKIIIYALDKELELENGYYLNELYKKMEGHILGSSEIKGIYRK